MICHKSQFTIIYNLLLDCHYYCYKICREKPGRSVAGLGAGMALWYASSTNPGERDFRARFLEVNQDVMSVSDQVGELMISSGLPISYFSI